MTTNHKTLPLKKVRRISVLLTKKTRFNARIVAELVAAIGRPIRKFDEASLKKIGGRDTLAQFWYVKIHQEPELMELAQYLNKLVTSGVDKKNPYNYTKFYDIQRQHRRYPTTAKQILSLGKAFMEEAKAVTKRSPVITIEESRARIAICEKCPFYDRKQERCMQCGCFVRMKSTWRSQHCPIDKW